MRRVFLAALSALLLTACVVAAPLPAPTDYALSVQMEPPAPLVEYVSTAPSPNHVWVSGYWWWSGVEWVWVRGHWAVRPYVDWVWVPSGWTWSGASFVFVSGYWAPPIHHAPHYVHPVPPPRHGERYRAVPEKRHPAEPAHRPKAPKGRPAN